MQFPIQPVPVSAGPKVQVQPPPMMDPATIIMQAAQLRQQKYLQEQQIAQKSAEDLMTAIQSAQSLSERKREAQAGERISQMTMDMALQKLPAEKALMQAHADYFNQMASGGDTAINGALRMLQSGLASPKDIYSLASRWPQNQKVKLMGALADSGVDLKGMGLDLLSKESGIKTEEGATFQQRIRGGESILPNFQAVVDQSNKLGLGTFAPANKIKLATMRLMNNPDVRKYDTLRSAVSEEMARYFGGGVASDAKIKLGQSILGDDGANAESIKASLLGDGGAYDVIQNQIKAYQPHSRNTPASTPTPAVTVTPAAATKIRVKRIKDGALGTIDSSDFDSGLYSKLQ